MTVALHQKPCVAPRCAWQAVQGDAVVIDLDGRRVMGLNKTASWVWTHLDGTRTVAQLVDGVAQTFAVTPEAAQSDVVEFLTSMHARGFLELS